MTHQYSYFRFDGDLDSVRSAIESALGFRLLERESSYWGGTYFQFRESASDVRLSLHRNIDHRGDWINPEFTGSRVLCSLSGPTEKVSAFVTQLLGAGGQLLASRSREFIDE